MMVGSVNFWSAIRSLIVVLSGLGILDLLSPFPPSFPPSLRRGGGRCYAPRVVIVYVVSACSKILFCKPNKILHPDILQNVSNFPSCYQYLYD